MNIEKAIETLNNHPVNLKSLQDHTYYKAVCLGIEALKFRQRWEQQEGEDDFLRLPGETEE